MVENNKAKFLKVFLAFHLLNWELIKGLMADKQILEISTKVNFH